MLFVLLFLVWAALPVNAALDPTKSLTSYVQRTWDIDSGLPQNSITAMVQSHDGYMWFGTEHGLARFDGRQFTIFDKQHYPGLLSNRISSLAVDKDNILWIGTRGGGLSSFQNGEFRSFFSQDGVAGNSVRCLLADAKDNLWIGTENSGLIRFSGGVFETYTVAAGLMDNSIVGLASDRKGSVWIATDAGLNLMERGRLTSVLRSDPARSDFIRCIYVDRQDSVWLGTNSQGLIAWRPGAARPATYRRAQGLSNESVISMFQDTANTLWVGTLGGGLNRLVAGKLTASTAVAGDGGSAITNIVEDREGGLWIGTLTHGATCLRNADMATLSRESGLPSETIMPVFEDAQQSLWVGTDRGLARMRNDGVSLFGSREGLPDEFISSIGQDGAGTLWIGTRRGLARLAGNRFYPIPAQPGLEPGFVDCLFTDRNGDIWAGSRNGLTHFDGAHFVTYTSQDGLPGNRVLCIQQSRSGAIWVGTDGGGVAVFREGRFTAYTRKDGLADDVILAITEDSDGNIFLGTNSAGLMRYSNGKFTAFGSVAGLPDDTIYQILDDQRGRLWLSSTKGIISLEKSGLDASKLNFRVFGTGDGMQTRECSGGFQPAGARTHDGRIWFPTPAGLVVVNPAELHEDDTLLGVNIERVAANDIWLPFAERFALSQEQRSLTIQYAAPSFLFSNHMQFRYWLTGFDEHWSNATTEQTARYTNLPPGNYEFRVSASRDGQKWMAEAQPLSLELPRHYYETAQFYFGSFSLFFAVFFAVHHLRIRTLRKAALEPAALTAGSAARLMAGSDLLRLSSSIFSGVANYSNSVGDEPVNDALAQLSFSLPSLLNDVDDLIGPAAQKRGLSLSIASVPAALQNVIGDSQALKQILINLLNNAIEFTPRGTVYLRVAGRMAARSESMLGFVITDNSPGVVPREFDSVFRASKQAESTFNTLFQGAAHRLHVSILMVRKMGGDLWMESSPGVGNTTHFTVPLVISISTPAEPVLSRQ